MATPITIIGDGAMGTVCAMIFAANGHAVTLWGPHRENVEQFIKTRRNERYLPDYKLPDSITLSWDESTAARDASLLVSAIPTQFSRSVWERFRGHVSPGVGIVSLAKGIESESLLRPTQIVLDALGELPDNAKTGDALPDARPVAAVSGPSIADELARGLPATVCVAGNSDALSRTVQELMTTSSLRVYTNPDLLGVELAGATKNVIALAAGMLDGLEAGHNAKSALLARGLAEIARLGAAMGARTETFFGVAGVGDLATTCYSPVGRNRTCGEALGKGKALDDVLASMHGVVEGVPTTRAVVTLADRHDIDMPITRTIAKVLFKGLDPMQGIGQLMSRSPKPERIG